MAVSDYELELETQIAIWQSSRHDVDGLMKFISRHRHIEIHMRMRGLVWSIQVLLLPNTTDYIFNIIEVKQSESPLDFHLSKATAADLPSKFKPLIVALQMYIRSVFRVEELLDKLYTCSRFLSRAENDKRWWIIVDAEIMAVAFKTAREATQEAAEAAAAFLAELMECFPRQNIITEELWATSFSAKEIWNGIAQAAVDEGDVLQWCKLQVLEMEKMIPCFEFEVAVQDFLQGNHEISRIGIVNSHALKVTVGLEDEIWVVCSQEGVETETSLGLSSLLPHLIRNYITTSLERNESEHGVYNIVEGLVKHVIGYLTFLPIVCVVCGSHRLLEVSFTSTCSNICEARKDMCRGALPLTWTSDGRWRREGCVTNSLSNTEAAQKRLSTLLVTDDVEMGWTPNMETVVRAGNGTAP
ncbi:hypothetical protein SUGI_0976330 [Cryptomeria japonica]|nr:hypothetical protein SUGI_0976330 [Cryptomeria japonica]